MALQRKLWGIRSQESTQGATAPNFGNCRGCAVRIPRRVCRRTKASFMRRQPCRTALGRHPADWKGRFAVWENREVREYSFPTGFTGFPEFHNLVNHVNPVKKYQSVWRTPFKIFPVRRRRFPIWFAVAKPHGMDAGAWGLPQCDGVKAVGSRSGTAHQFPNFGAVAP